MKTIVRWTVGNVSDSGFLCLRLSVKRAVEMYGHRNHEYFVCHNGDSKNKIRLHDTRVSLLDQNKFVNSLPIPPSEKFGVSWKLYPPRIDLDAHEIFMDNDVVLHKKIEFEKYSETCLISEAVKRSYGSFDDRIKESVPMNSGLFGLPSGFDFGSSLSETILKFNVHWHNSYFEEQGTVAYVVSNREHVVLRKKDMGLAWQNAPDFIGEYGTHFIGLNSGYSDYWKKYRTIF